MSTRPEKPWQRAPLEPPWGVEPQTYACRVPPGSSGPVVVGAVQAGVVVAPDALDLACRGPSWMVA